MTSGLSITRDLYRAQMRAKDPDAVLGIVDHLRRGFARFAIYLSNALLLGQSLPARSGPAKKKSVIIVRLIVPPELRCRLRHRRKHRSVRRHDLCPTEHSEYSDIQRRHVSQV